MTVSPTNVLKPEPNELRHQNTETPLERGSSFVLLTDVQNQSWAGGREEREKSTVSAEENEHMGDTSFQMLSLLKLPISVLHDHTTWKKHLI